jgi:rod shape determining protein RodA
VLSIDRRTIQNFDWVLFGLVGLLLVFALANLYSATHAFGEPGLPEPLRRQLAALAVGGVALVVICAVDYRHFDRLALAVYAGVVLLVASTLVLAPVTRGAQAWLFEGRFQPSEYAKLAVVLALARYFSRHPPSEITRLRDLLRPGLLVAVPVGLIVLQRDLGVALLTLAVATTFLPFVRIPARSWVAVAAAGALALAALWTFGLATYQRQRILDFLDPARDPLSSGYQAMQSRIAVGSGGLLGTGYLQGTQTQLRFLPTQHTDFAFSVLAEEWGFAGSAVVLGLYLCMLLWGLVIARNAKDSFGSFLAVGMVGALFWPAAINVAMVLGLAPVIGVPLPFFSYGGSALLSATLAVGFLLNVSMRRYVF